MAAHSIVATLLLLSLVARASAFDLSVSPADVLTAGLKESAGIDLSMVVRLSDKEPRAFLYKSFLSDEECDHIVNIATARLARSAVADGSSGKSVVSEVRTSTGMFLTKGEDDVIRAIEQRVSEWTFFPWPIRRLCRYRGQSGGSAGRHYGHTGEKHNPHPHLDYSLPSSLLSLPPPPSHYHALPAIATPHPVHTVLRYGVGQKYDPHLDYLFDPVNTRLHLLQCAVLWYAIGQKYDGHVDYFSHPVNMQLQVLRYAIGQKYDAHLDYFFGPRQHAAGRAPLRHAATLKPIKGDALRFFNMHPHGSPAPPIYSMRALPSRARTTLLQHASTRLPCPASLHHACPVVEGINSFQPTPLHLPFPTPLHPSPPLPFPMPPVKPIKGDALLFFNMHPDGSPDPSSLHHACPVVEGIKWSAPKWIRMGDVTVPLGDAVTAACQDSNA
ncbi:unnamed protein product [Closterium sp. NIES-64]|nr:unnamed protein product [Closterium sp. NIES-64]